MNPTLREQQEAREKDFAIGLDRLFTLVNTRASRQTIEEEMTRAVEKMTTRYQTLLAIGEAERSQRGDVATEDRLKALREQYRQDLILLAVSVDQAMAEAEQLPDGVWPS